MPQQAAIPIPAGWTATRITRGGVVLGIRPVQPGDEAALTDLFEHVAPADLHFRFLSSMRHVDKTRIDEMVHVDYHRTISFLAFDATGAAVATAMLAADEAGRQAEVAISVRSALKGKGIGWTLLQHVLRYGEAQGYEAIRSIESRQNIPTIELERDAGFELHGIEGDPADVVAVKHLLGHPA